MDYLACGNIMVDRIIKEDGSVGSVHMGGPAFFALAGMRAFTENCMLRSNVGADFYDYYGEWLNYHNQRKDGIEVRAEKTTSLMLKYGERGKFTPEFVGGAYRGIEGIGFMKIQANDLDEITAKEKPKAIYIAYNQDKFIWDGFYKAKKKNGFKIVWESELAAAAMPGSDIGIANVQSILPFVDVISLNMNEASALYGLDSIADESKIIEGVISDFDVDMIFLRAGEKGCFVIQDKKSYFVPSLAHLGVVDPTGCGNCSTGGFAYGYGEGNDPIRCAAYANVAASFNVAQYGVHLQFTKEKMEEAKALVEKNYQAAIK